MNVDSPVSCASLRGRCRRRLAPVITIRRSLDVAALLGSFALAMSLTGQALALPTIPRPAQAESTPVSPPAVDTVAVQPASYNPTATTIALSLVASGFTK